MARDSSFRSTGSAVGASCERCEQARILERREGRGAGDRADPAGEGGKLFRQLVGGTLIMPARVEKKATARLHQQELGLGMGGEEGLEGAVTGPVGLAQVGAQELGHLLGCRRHRHRVSGTGNKPGAVAKVLEMAWRRLRRDDGIGSGGEVNRARRRAAGRGSASRRPCAW